MPHASVVIIGGGLIGSSIAYHLARRGVKSIICERGTVAAEASGANAGALWPQGELSEPGPYLELALASFNCFPRLAEELAELTGIDIEFQWSGLLDVIPDRRQYQAIEAALSWRRSMGLSFELMNGDALRRFEPAVSHRMAGGLFFPREGDVNPMALNNAFAVGARRMGATYLAHTNVTGIEMRDSQVVGVRTAEGQISADVVVIAAGAWSPPLGALLGLRIPVRPVRGQIMVTEVLPKPFTHCIVGEHTYLVPKAKGNVVIGATQEEVGYHKAMTVTGLASLATDAAKMVPALRNVSIVRSWCGLRPGSADDWPFLGSVPGRRGLLLATGHFRNGCLLSPITGQLIAGQVVDGRPSLSLRPFHLDRFSDWEM